MIQRRQEDGEFVTAKTRDHVVFAQLRTHAGGHGDQDGITGRMAVGVVDVFEAVAVEEQHGDFIVGRVGCAQGSRQPRSKVGAIGQVGERVMAGLMRQRLVFDFQVALPRLQLVQQRIEVIAQAVHFSNLCRGHAAVEGPLTARSVGHLSQFVQRPGDAIEQAPRQVQRTPGT